jgi:hypothetical protein
MNDTGRCLRFVVTERADPYVPCEYAFFPAFIEVGDILFRLPALENRYRLRV